MEKPTLEERIKTTLDKFSLFLSKDKEKEAVKLEAQEAKEDGTIVYTDAEAFAVGVSVFIKEGEDIIPAPDGEHKLENGSVVVVADGVVSTIQEKAVEEEMASEPEYATKADLAELAQGIYDALQLSQELATSSTDTATKIEELTTQLSKSEEARVALEEVVSKIPMAASVTKKEKKEVVKLSEAEVKELSSKDYIKYMASLS